MYQTALYLFRQDLRVQDNTALYHASQETKHLLPVFIFDTTILKQFPPQDKRLGFLLETVRNVQQAIHALQSDLHVYYGDPKKIIPALAAAYQVEAIYQNRSYGRGSKTRDQQTASWAKKHNIDFHQCADWLLVEPGDVEQRKVFTPFYRLWMQQPKQRQPTKIKRLPPLPKEQNISDGEKLELDKKSILEKIGGAKQTYRKADQAKAILQNFDHTTYTTKRNIPSENGTSQLSPYIRFGSISIREVFSHVLNLDQPGVTYHKSDKTVTMNHKVFEHTYISELAWREFRHHILHYFPDSLSTEFLEKRRNLKWVNNKVWFEAWKEGKTGYPIVDAGMRQLKTIHRMHNRLRMIVASFLTKDLLIDRRWGESHFANYLLDHDLAVNTGNWQRAASVGADPKPLRIFNPILQSKRFDPDARYIKQWIPELADAPLKAIHNPLKYELNYYKPIVDHYITSKAAKKMYMHEKFSI